MRPLPIGLLAALIAAPAVAHGLVGERFFPATLATDDPFVADELSAPTFSTRKLPASGDEPARRESEISVELAKRLTPDLALSAAAGYLRKNPADGPSMAGWNNVELGLKYQLLADAPSETVVSAALGWEIERTGTTRIGAEPFSVLTPALLAGKGFGDAPVEWLRPLALTGMVGLALPLRAKTRTYGEDDVEVERHADMLVWGGSLQYSLPYLQAQVRDLGLPEALGRLVPVVEVALATPLNRETAGHTTGTVNPGLLWIGESIQLGLELQVPINQTSGHGLGVIGQLHFYLDDLFPTTLGRPVSQW